MTCCYVAWRVPWQYHIDISRGGVLLLQPSRVLSPGSPTHCPYTSIADRVESPLLQPGRGAVGPALTGVVAVLCALEVRRVPQNLVPEDEGG